MKPAMDPLDRRLADLPAERASRDFTNKVMSRLDELPASRADGRARTLVWALVAVGIAVLALPTLTPPNQDPAARLTAEVTEIRRQHRLLTHELNRLRARTEETAPILYLGGVDEIDYVLDLSPFLLPQTSRAMPASNEENSTF